MASMGIETKGILIHSFLLTKKTPWVHESVNFCTTYGSKQVSTVLNGELAMRCSYSEGYIRTGVYEESVMATVGGGSGFKLLPLWCLPLRFAGFSGGPTTWKVRVSDCGSILVSFVSRWCHKDNTLPLREFQLKIDKDTGYPMVKARGTSWRNPHKVQFNPHNLYTTIFPISAPVCTVTCVCTIFLSHAVY